MDVLRKQMLVSARDAGNDGAEDAAAASFINSISVFTMNIRPLSAYTFTLLIRKDT